MPLPLDRRSNHTRRKPAAPRPPLAVDRYRAKYKYRQPLGDVPYCHAGHAVVGDPAQLQINGALAKVGLAEMRLVLRTECTWDLWVALLRARDPLTAHCERALRWLNRSIGRPRGRPPNAANGGAYSDSQLERSMRTLEQAGLVVRLARRYGVTSEHAHGRRERPELHLVVTRLVVGGIAGTSVLAPPAVRQMLAALPRKGRPQGWRKAAQRPPAAATETTPRLYLKEVPMVLHAENKPGAGTCILTNTSTPELEVPVNASKNEAWRGGEPPRAETPPGGSQGGAGSVGQFADLLARQMRAREPDRSPRWVHAGELFRPARGAAPECPGRLVPTCQDPGPPRLLVSDPPLRMANALARTYVGAIRAILGVKTHAFSRGVSETTRSYGALVAAGRKLAEHDVAPARWAWFAVSRWVAACEKAGRDPRKKAPPITYVFSAGQIESDRGWCRDATEDALQRKTYYPPGYWFFYRLWSTLDHQVVTQCRTVADVDRCVDDAFPDRHFVDQVLKYRRWVTDKRAELLARVGQFEWVWEEP